MFILQFKCLNYAKAGKKAEYFWKQFYQYRVKEIQGYINCYLNDHHHLCTTDYIINKENQL